MEDHIGVNSGKGMVIGFAIALIFGPALGSWAPPGLIIGAAIGLVFGAGVTLYESDP
jgi:hypothetical protein